MPSAAVVLTNLFVVAGPGEGGYGINFLWSVPVGVVAIIGGCIAFAGVIRDCYAGRSKVLLNFGYFLGQIIVCLTVGLGSCLALASIHR